MSASIIAVCNEKGGVGKTTSAVHLAQAFSINGWKTLVVDMDSQGNASQGLGFKTKDLDITIADLIWDKTIPTEKGICSRSGSQYSGDLDVIVANGNLARVGRAMATLTNSELRLAQRLRALGNAYDYIIIDAAPGFGSLLNSVLNSADFVIVPVDSNFYALLGIQRLLSEIEEIKGTNPGVQVLGYLMTMVDRTIVAGQALNVVEQNFGSLVFGRKIRRAVAFREAPMLGRTVFEYEPFCAAADDYMHLWSEVKFRINGARQKREALKVVEPLCAKGGAV